jgi:hypothetical protein
MIEKQWWEDWNWHIEYVDGKHLMTISVPNSYTDKEIIVSEKEVGTETYSNISGLIDSLFNQIQMDHGGYEHERKKTKTNS